VLFLQPYFVTPHAVRCYRGLISRHASAALAIRQVQAALQEPLDWHEVRAGGIVYLCELPDGRRFGAVVMPPSDDGLPWPAVVTVGEPWRWHEFNRWRRVPRRPVPAGYGRQRSCSTSSPGPAHGV